jgi:hypothetical protein
MLGLTAVKLPLNQEKLNTNVITMQLAGLNKKKLQAF